jgi:hypothetical protein
VYGPLKAYLFQEMDRRRTNHPGERITDYTLGTTIRKAYIKAFTPHNIMRGFQQADISLFNPNVYTYDIIIETSTFSSSGSAVASSVKQSGPSND